MLQRCSGGSAKCSKVLLLCGCRQRTSCLRYNSCTKGSKNCWRKVGRIQHPKWRPEKFVVHVLSAHLSAATKLPSLCPKRVVCYHGTSKCSMGSAQQSAAISKVWPNPKGRKVACQTAAQSHSLGLAKCCRSSRGTESHQGDESTVPHACAGIGR